MKSHNKYHIEALNQSTRRRALRTIAGVLVGTSAVGTVGARNQITEIDEPTVIDEPGEYVLTSDITSVDIPIIRIEADRVTLNGTGHTLAGDFRSPGWSQLGIEANSVKNVNIQDVTVTNFGRGISITNAKNCSVKGVTATQCHTSGITIQTSNSTVQGNTLRNIYEGTGIHVGGSNNTVAENDIGSLDTGLILRGPSTKVRNNTVDRTVEGIVIYGNNQLLTNNTITNSDIWGVYISNSINNKIIQNYFQYAPISGDTENSIIRANEIDE